MNNEETSNFSRNLPTCTGPNIRRLREEQQISCTKLAKMIGTSTSFIARIEKGERLRASYAILKNIADVLNCSLDALIEEEGMIAPSAEKQRYRVLQLVEKIIVSEELTHDETVHQLELVLKISENILKN